MNAIDNTGEENGRAILSEKDVVLVKQFLQRHPPVASKTRGGQCGFLARFFGVSRKTISQIATGRNWRHVQ